MDFSSISSSATVVEVFSQAVQKPARFQFITSPAPNRRSHEVRRISALRDRFRAPRAKTSAQPLSHNPRKQWKNPAAAGSGERFRGGKWRRDRDSNPGDGLPPTHFPGVRLRPLGHLSLAMLLAGPGVRVQGRAAVSVPENCSRYRSAYTPPRASNSAWVP
jgi:hypothetical protein